MPNGAGSDMESTKRNFFFPVPPEGQIEPWLGFTFDLSEGRISVQIFDHTITI